MGIQPRRKHGYKLQPRSDTQRFVHSSGTLYFRGTVLLLHFPFNHFFEAALPQVPTGISILQHVELFSATLIKLINLSTRRSYNARFSNMLHVNVTPRQHVTLPGWTPGTSRDIRKFGKGAMFTPLRTLRRCVAGEVEVIRSVAPPCDTVVHRRIFLHSSQNRERQDILREMKRLRNLVHPHIVSIVGTYEEQYHWKADHEYGILMDPIGDQDLEIFLTQIDNGEEQQRRQHRVWLHGWLSCLASALRYIHRNGLRHKNIAPKNIIHRGSQVYFTDFGISTRLRRSQATASLLYAAPEIDRIGHEGHTKRSDIFSLGCLFLEMLTAIDNRSVNGFRMHCRGSRENDDAKPFRYYSALPEIRKWFSYRDFDNEVARDWWGRAILPMLNENEDDRPKAIQTLRRFQTADLLPDAPNRFCRCHPSNPIPYVELEESVVMPAQIEFFEIPKNVHKDFEVELVEPARCRPWHELKSLPSFDYREYTFRIGSLVWIRNTDGSDSLAEIAEAKSVGDGTARILIRVFWYYSREKKLVDILRSSQRLFPKSYKYIKSNHTEVLLWDTIQREITETERAKILRRRTLDMFWEPHYICSSSAPGVSWANVVLDG